jgi:hypothetical protein
MKQIKLLIANKQAIDEEVAEDLHDELTAAAEALSKAVKLDAGSVSVLEARSRRANQADRQHGLQRREACVSRPPQGRPAGRTITLC